MTYTRLHVFVNLIGLKKLHEQLILFKLILAYFIQYCFFVVVFVIQRTLLTIYLFCYINKHENWYSLYISFIYLDITLVGILILKHTEKTCTHVMICDNINRNIYLKSNM